MRPRFLDQPFFSQRTPRSGHTRAEYASPVTIYTTPWWRRLPDWLVAIITVAACAATGCILAWRG